MITLARVPTVEAIPGYISSQADDRGAAQGTWCSDGTPTGRKQVTNGK
jgi:hypothetical protein